MKLFRKDNICLLAAYVNDTVIAYLSTNGGKSFQSLSHQHYKRSGDAYGFKFRDTSRSKNDKWFEFVATNYSTSILRADTALIMRQVNGEHLKILYLPEDEEGTLDISRIALPTLPVATESLKWVQTIGTNNPQWVYISYDENRPLDDKHFRIFAGALCQDMHEIPIEHIERNYEHVMIQTPKGAFKIHAPRSSEFDMHDPACDITWQGEATEDVNPDPWILAEEGTTIRVRA